MRILHFADAHGSPERSDEFLASLAVLRTEAAKGVDLIVGAGDLWDTVIRNTAGSRFPEMVEAVRALADHAPLVMIYGTPTHDAEGSLEVFKTLTSKHGITVLEPGKAYQLVPGPASVPSLFELIDEAKNLMLGAKAILFGVPEPSKKWLMPYFGNKDEAEQAVRDGLRNLFAGLGAVRRRYPSLPCVLVYHGQVAGARLQNGDVLDGGSGIRPSIDDLAAVGADYIAMGDIHEPQRLTPLPAYYPGSIYPVNFGETHRAGANLVEISQSDKTGDLSLLAPDRAGFAHTLTRIHFPHPVNQTIQAALVPTALGTMEISRDIGASVRPGSRVKLVISLDRYYVDKVDEQDLLTKLTAAGAAPGSIVTLNVLPTETVRAQAITEKTTALDKVGVWFEQSAKEFTPELREKVAQVEALAVADGAVGRGDRIRLNRLVLRGAIGLWKKSGLDEVDINLDEIEEGLVALIGGNGAGKTTILENMHPWPGLLTRDGVLKDHFRGRDACRDLYWTDTATGWKYRALITINAAVASGATEYYLYRDQGAGFQPMPGIEGRKDAYVEAIDRIFGSQDLYLRSAFVTQRQPKGFSDLADATPKERKTLFTALCGIEYWEAYKARAKGFGDELQVEVDKKATESAVLAGRLPDEAAIRAEIQQWTEDLDTVRGDLMALGEVGKHKAGRVDTLSVLVKAEEAKREELAGLRQRIAELEGKLARVRTQITEDEAAVNLASGAPARILDHEDMTLKLASLRAEYEGYRQAIDAERAEVDKARAAHEAKRAELDAERRKIEDAHQEEVRARTREMDNVLRQYSASRDVEIRHQHRIEHLEKELAKPVTESCPTCGQSLPAESLDKIRNDRQELEAQLAEARNLLATASGLTQNFDAQYAALKEQRDTVAAPSAPGLPAFTPPPSKAPPFDSGRIAALEQDIAFVNVEAARKLLTGAEVAKSRIVQNQAMAEDVLKDLAQTCETNVQVYNSLRPELAAELADLQVSLENTRELYRQAQGTEARAVAMLQQAQGKLEALAKDRQELEAVRTALAALQSEVAQWRLLELAFSDKGVQALELDAVAPSIASIANGLLKGAFGSRYQIEFQTTRLGGTGARQKQIEDFLINVLDTETGETQELSTLSGGEAVWIRRALYDAFGIIRARNTGLLFLTAFQDEADGALDPVARLTYLRMLEAAHALAGRSHTLIITHSEALQELIPTRLVVSQLKPRPVADKAA